MCIRDRIIEYTQANALGCVQKFAVPGFDPGTSNWKIGPLTTKLASVTLDG